MNKVVSVLVVAVSALLMVAGPAAGVEQGDENPITTVHVTVDYTPEDELIAPLIVDELGPETVLIIRATGFDADTTGTIRQCAHGADRRCRNPLSVRFDDQGTATFQYLISHEVGRVASATDPCRLGAARCTLELAVGEKTTVIDTIFVDESPPPGHLDITPRRDLRLGDTVTIAATGFPPATELTVTVCAAPSTSGRRCGAPAPVTSQTTAVDGTAQVEIVLDVAEVGADRVACGRRTTCRVVVSSADAGVWARPVTLDFEESPGADYDAARLAIGLGAAAVMVAIAAWLVRATDWAPPRESDSPTIDNAVLADLDAEAAQFDELETTRSR